jgi:hypothetical protein
VVGGLSIEIRGATTGCRVAAPPTVLHWCAAARAMATPEPPARAGHQNVTV